MAEGKRISLGTSDYTRGADVRPIRRLTATKREAPAFRQV
jgi:hypothetical protein